MSDFNKTLPITQVKRDLLGLLKEVQKTEESIAITRKGIPAAVLMSIDEYEGLMETVEILSDAKLMNIIRTSREQAKKGKLVPHQQVWKD